jgi:hypothetical protein
MKADQAEPDPQSVTFLIHFKALASQMAGA